MPEEEGVIPDRIQCTIREYPPRNSTFALGKAILDEFRLVGLIVPYDGYSNTSGTVLYPIDLPGYLIMN